MIDDATLASFYAGELEDHEEDAVRDHLVDCPTCLAQARDAASFVEAINDEARDVAGERRFGGGAAWRLAMAAVFAAAAILFMWRTGMRPFDSTARWRELTVEAAGYAPDDSHGIVWRGGEGPAATPEEGSLAWAMEPYVAKDYVGAVERLNRRVRDDPGDEQARFYLGVSLLLTGHPAESVEPLRRVAEESDPLSSDASWYLAVAWIKTGDEDRAVALLQDLAAQPGDRGERARALLADIGGRSKR
jgi:hypothetical protein